MRETAIFCELCGQLSIWWKVDGRGRTWALCDDHRHALGRPGPEQLGDIITRILRTPAPGRRRRRGVLRPFRPEH